MIGALTFNPAVAAVGSAVCAVVWTRAAGWGGRVVAVAILLGGWALADGGIAVMLAERTSAAFGVSTGALSWAGVAASMLIGYAVPAWAGVFVGERVTVGTGWLSAAAVALSVSGALSAIVGRLG